MGTKRRKAYNERYDQQEHAEAEDVPRGLRFHFPLLSPLRKLSHTLSRKAYQNLTLYSQTSISPEKLEGPLELAFPEDLS